MNTGFSFSFICSWNRLIRYFRFIIPMALLFQLLYSCEYLNYNEADNYNSDAIFLELGRATSFLNNIYTYLPTDFSTIDGAMRSSASDDAEHVWDYSKIQRFNDGSWSSIQTVDDNWSKMYSGIRAVNLFLKETKGQKYEDLAYTPDYAERMIRFSYCEYEARYLRAFFYFELIKRYKDVPLITTVLTEEEAANVKQTSFSSIVDFIVSECDSLSTKLPVNFKDIPGQETGRANRNAALALKAHTLLYAASPLFNPANYPEKWIAAAAAAKVLIDRGKYNLEPIYGDFLNKYSSGELIAEKRQDYSNSFEAANFPIGYEGGKTGTCPSQNLVDSYEMAATGMGIDQAGSGYDPANPYTGRDPRLSATVLVNGAMWKGTPVESWYGGLNGPPKNNATKTGYYLKKYLIESISLDPVNSTTQVHTWVIFRYAEVLLNYAEAMNEVYGPSGSGAGSLNLTATAAVNQVRKRAKMPNFPDGMTKEDFRNKLRNERRVEFAFEDQRFWDIRRWKIGGATTDIYGVAVTRDPSGNLSFMRKLVEKRIWEDKMYLYPFPQNEVFINPSIKQNEGW